MKLRFLKSRWKILKLILERCNVVQTTILFITSTYTMPKYNNEKSKYALTLLLYCNTSCCHTHAVDFLQTHPKWVVSSTYILDSSNSSSITVWTNQFGSSSRSNWTGIWTGNSNDKQSSHFSTATEMGVKATLFFM